MSKKTSISIHHDGKTEEIALEPLPKVGNSAEVEELTKRVESVEAAMGNPSGKLDGGTF